MSYIISMCTIIEQGKDVCGLSYPEAVNAMLLFDFKFTVKVVRSNPLISILILLSEILLLKIAKGSNDTLLFQNTCAPASYP